MIHQKEDPNATATVYGLLRRQASRFADHDLLVLPAAVQTLWQLPQSSWTYAGFLCQVNQLVERYRTCGYGSGHRVALLLGNQPAHFLHWLALNALGASIVPLNPDASPDEQHYILTHSDSALLVCLPQYLKQIQPVSERAGIALTTDNLTGLPLAPARPNLHNDAASERECALLYTSGTTGRPKGCQLSNAYFYGWSDWYCAQGGLITLRHGQERLITPLPTFHVNAMGNSFMGMLASGGAQVIVDRFHPRSWWTMAAQTRATCFHYLGVMPAMLLQLPKDPNEDAHQLRFGMGGGVQPEHHAAFESRFNVPLLEGWAMTETGGAGILCAASEPRNIGKRCVGNPDRPGPAMETRLVDEHGEDVKPGEVGELLLRATGDKPRRQFFSGYLKDAAATEALWDGGWMHTGDIMTTLPDGSLCFVDRKKNIIRRSGENIAAIDVEICLAAHPRVARAAVVATADPIRGEEVMAVIVPTPEKDNEKDDKKEDEKNQEQIRSEVLLATELLEYCASRLAYFKIPGYVSFVDSIPTTATQKLRKAELRELIANPTAHPRTVDLREQKQKQRNPSRRSG
ncbi:MAG: AMP-binding protein [Burkholderiaceae bacterium]